MVLIEEISDDEAASLILPVVSAAEAIIEPLSDDEDEEQNQSTTGGLEQQIYAFLTPFFDYWKERQLDMLAQVFNENSVMSFNGQPASGREAILAMLVSAEMLPECQILTVDLQITDQFALVLATGQLASGRPLSMVLNLQPGTTAPFLVANLGFFLLG